MSLLDQARSAVADEHGGVMVLFAVFAPVAVLLVSLVIDGGNSFVHNRHLQTQADAGALAAAQLFQPCQNEKIYERAGEYGGASAVITPSGTVTVHPENAKKELFNTQGGTPQSRMKVLINSKRYYKQTSHVDGTAEERPPCEALMVDVKATETDQPWYVKVFHSVFNGVPYDNAHARVEVLQEKEPSGVEPLAVAESAPVAARAYFVNEDEGANGVALVEKGKALASAALVNTGPNGAGQEIWSSVSTPVSLEINKPHIGVVIALSGNRSDTKCGDDLVKCFDPSTGPLLHIAGYSEGGTGTLTAPVAHQVILSAPLPSTCTDAYFSHSTTTCTLSISAKLDYGSAKTQGMTVNPVVKGKEGAALKLEGGLWKGAIALNGAGSNEIALLVKCNSKISEAPCAASKKNTSGTVANVQRGYAASEAGSGTITGAWIGEVGGAVQDANSFEICEAQNAKQCTHKLTVTLNVGGGLADAQKYSDPLYHMRFGNSQAEVVGCEPGKEASGSAYREHLARGCEGRYIINTNDPSCTSKTEPYDCIGFASGVKTGPFSQGLEKRFVSEPPQGKRYYECNNWTKTNGEGVPLIPSDDSRVIQLFIEPYASNGAKSAPIQDFATFYVTGWDGDPSKCKNPTDDSTSKGEIVGHFIKYINTLDTKEGGGQKCALNSLGQCVTVLTR